MPALGAAFGHMGRRVRCTDRPDRTNVFDNHLR